MKTSWLFTIAIALLLACMGGAYAAAPHTDHPLISGYEGSDIRKKDVKEFDAYRAFTGMDATGKEPTGLELEGKVTRIVYSMPKERSVLEVFRNYEVAVKRAGAEILFSCNQENSECAKAYAQSVIGKYSGISSISNTVGRYLLAKIKQDDGTVYVAVAVGRITTQLDVIEIKAMDEGMVTLDATAMGEGLDAQGFVIVEGIYFDTDKATLQSKSDAALAEMGKLLKSRASTKVYVVGHTDTQGSLPHNMELSGARAKAVVEALAGKHGIARDRMAGHGVGPLAPQASNADESGRAKNRRVVLVAR